MNGEIKKKHACQTRRARAQCLAIRLDRTSNEVAFVAPEGSSYSVRSRLRTAAAFDLRTQIPEISRRSAAVTPPKRFHTVSRIQVKECKDIHVATSTLFIVDKTFVTQDPGKDY
jgi:hypothetical protein